MLVNHLRSVGAGMLLTLEHVVFQVARLFRRRRPLQLATLVWEPPAETACRVMPPSVTWRLPRDPEGLPN